MVLTPDSGVLNVIASFLLILIIVYLVVKCVVSCMEDKKLMKEWEQGNRASKKDVEMKEVS